MLWLLDNVRLQATCGVVAVVGLVVLVAAVPNGDLNLVGLGALLACGGALPVGLRFWDHARRRGAALRVVPTALPHMPGWDHPFAERFTVQGKPLLRMVAVMAPLFLLFAAIMTILGSIPFGEDGLLPGIAIGVICTGALFYVFYRKARAGALTTIVRMSPAGVELWDDAGTHMRVPWNATTTVGNVDTPMVDPGQRATSGAGGGAGVRVAPLRGVGIIGWGEHALGARSPVWLLERIAAQPRHPETGAQQVAIPLGQVDPSWLDGRMGAWIQRHRPDLMDQAAR